VKIILREQALLPGGGSRLLSTVLLPVATLAGIVVAWQIFAWLLRLPVWILPSPTSIVEATLKWSPVLPMHIGITLYETLAGFMLAIVVGVSMAVLVVYSPILQTTIYPILLSLQSVPKVAIAPVLLIWVGYGQLPKIIVVFLVCFFPIIVSTATGLNSVPGELLDLVRSLSPTQFQIFVKIRFPAAMSHIFVGLKVAITLAVVGAVIGEFVGSERGLGYLILAATSQLNTPLAFGAMVLLTLMSIVLYYALEGLERLIAPWAREEQQP
jgi:NitT/TauT family transport system permease protein